MIEKCCPGSLDLHAISCCVLVACSTWHGLCTSCKSFASSRGATAHISCLIDFDGWASRYDSKWVTPKMDDWIQSILTSLWSKNGNHSHVQNKPSTQGQHLRGTKNRCYIQRIWGPQGNQDQGFQAPECPPSVNKHGKSLRTIQQICFKKINRNGVECMMILEVGIHNFFSRTRYILLELSYHSPNYICLSSLNIYRTISRYVAGWYHLYLITNIIHYHPRQKSVQPPGPSAQRDQRLEIAQGTKWHLATSSTDESDFSATKKAPILICLIKFFAEQPNPPSIVQVSLGLWHCT